MWKKFHDQSQGQKSFMFNITSETLKYVLIR